jgi:hypothetical protein
MINDNPKLNNNINKNANDNRQNNNNFNNKNINMNNNNNNNYNKYTFNNHNKLKNDIYSNKNDKFLTRSKTMTNLIQFFENKNAKENNLNQIKRPININTKDISNTKINNLS